jgi:hypothetical protein
MHNYVFLKFKKLKTSDYNFLNPDNKASYLPHCQEQVLGNDWSALLIKPLTLRSVACLLSFQNLQTATIAYFSFSFLSALQL